MKTIEELHDNKKHWGQTMYFLKEPLLEYVWELAQSTFAPEDDLSSFPCLFANRYFERNLSVEERYERDKELNYTSNSFEKYVELKSNHRQFKDSFKDKFLNNEDLQNTIEAFGLDVSKFWYLLLFVYDYTESICTKAPTIIKTLKEDFLDYCECLLTSTDIVLKENGKKIYETERKELIDIIKIVHLNFIKAYSDIITSNQDYDEKKKRLREIGLTDFINNDLLTGIDYKNTTSLDISYKKWKFAVLFQRFLRNKKASTIPNKKVKVSKDKMMLISRLIYTVGYDTKRYNEEYDEKGNKNRMLSNLLRKYSKQKFPDVTSNEYF